MICLIAGVIKSIYVFTLTQKNGNHKTKKSFNNKKQTGYSNVEYPVCLIFTEPLSKDITLPLEPELLVQVLRERELFQEQEQEQAPELEPELPS
ncbi:MAG: hypothetical protein WCH07_01495 [Deltaproteobacteria bacterium]